MIHHANPRVEPHFSWAYIQYKGCSYPLHSLHSFTMVSARFFFISSLVASPALATPLAINARATNATIDQCTQLGSCNTNDINHAFTATLKYVWNFYSTVQFQPFTVAVCFFWLKFYLQLILHNTLSLGLRARTVFQVL